MKALSIDKTLYLRLLEYVKPYKRRFIIGLAASIPTSALEALMAWSLGPFVDSILTAKDTTYLMWIPLVIVGISLLQGVFQYISQYATAYVGMSITQDLRYDLFKKMLQMDWAYFKTTKPGQFITRYNMDPVRLQEAIVGSLQDFIVQFVAMITLAAVLFYRNWQFALIAISIISLVGIPLVIITNKIRRLDHKNTDASAALMDVFQESFQGVQIIKLHNLNAYQEKLYKKSLERAFGISMSIRKAGAFLKPITQLITSIGISLILLIGSLQVVEGKMSAGDLTSFLVALLLMYKPVKNVTGIVTKVERIMAPAERVFEKMDLESALVQVEQPKTIDAFQSLTFENVGFSYQPDVQDKAVLQSINFRIDAGETVALVGPSGSGKTTLMNLIPRLMDPTEGRILMNGVDLRELSLGTVMSQMSMVTQDPQLFGGTIRENIQRGNLNATEDEIWQAVRSACLEEWVNTLPEGLDTEVGDRGNRLSGGQKQRIAIARAFVKNAPILLLDEPTSALDNESEAMIQQALTELQKGRTVLVIAHRLSTIKIASRIMVLHAGEILETGSHQELLAKQGFYSKLYYLQFRDDEPVELVEANAAG